ncbi:hypothetical protein AKJ16_DCAP02158 [Drosera capensis]
MSSMALGGKTLLLSLHTSSSFSSRCLASLPWQPSSPTKYTLIVPHGTSPRALESCPAFCSQHHRSHTLSRRGRDLDDSQPNTNKAGVEIYFEVVGTYAKAAKHLEWRAAKDN